MSRLSWVIVFLFVLLISRAARADELTVDVRPAAASLDAEALRRGVADELRDSNASGTIVVDIDAGDIVVTYGKLTRRVAKPADAADARKAAIALAGNLARDEASELAAALKKKPEPPPPPPAPAPPPPAKKPTTEPFPETASLRDALAVHAAREKRFRMTMGITMVALGAGTVTAGAAMAEKDDLKVASAYAISGGTILLINGVTSMLARSTYERLADDPNSTEEDWIRAAESEHTWRKVEGVIDIVVGATFMGTGTFILANQAPTSATERQTSAAFSFAFGIGGTIAGIWRLSTPGPLESGLKDWQTAIRPNVAIVPGGAVASVAISF